MAKADYVNQTAIVQKTAADPRCRWRFTGHALQRMSEFVPPVTVPDIQKAVTNGHVTFEELKKDVLWRVQGPDLDGNTIQVVVAVYETEVVVKVVTVF